VFATWAQILTVTTAVEFRDALKDSIAQSSMPLVALDVPITVFEEMSKNTNWIGDDTTWRLVLTGFPPQQSAYAHQIRDAVVKKKNDGCKFLILFAVKEERASLLTF
jgi:eukaryotic translation initiation factor 2-alpha kinase 4